jgi:hypothetical protein
MTVTAVALDKAVKKKASMKGRRRPKWKKTKQTQRKRKTKKKGREELANCKVENYLDKQRWRGLIT